MKKLVSLALALILLLASLTACTTPASANTKAPIATVEATETAEPTEAPVTGTAGSPAESFAKYMQVKATAYDRLSKKMEGNEELALYGMVLLPVSLVDLTLIPLSAMTADAAAGQAALEMLGMKDIKIDNAGGKFSITYTDSEGKKATQTATYDAATESVQSSVNDETGKEILFFEYVSTGSGYAAQYYMVDETGTTVITAVFDDSSLVAFGLKSVTEKPASIYKNSGVTVDLVKDADTYLILDGDKLTVHDENGDKTY